MKRLSVSIVLGGLALAAPAAAADLREAAPAGPVGRFRATCEDLGKLCFADACGRDQIAAAQGCRALCPSAAVVEVVPARCALPAGPAPVVLRRRG